MRTARSRPSGTIVDAAVTFMHSAVAPERPPQSSTAARSAGSSRASSASSRTKADAAANASIDCGKSVVGLDGSFDTLYIMNGMSSTTLKRFCARLPRPR